MKKIILMMLLVIVLAGMVWAGTFKPGETVTYSVVCLTDDGSKDPGCTGNDDDILPGNDTASKAPTSALAEVSDANFPGLWRGSYLVPAGAYIGVWSIFIELTNSNGTLGATTLHILVANYSLNGLGDDLANLDSNVDAVHTGIGTNQSYLNTSFSNRFGSVDTNLNIIYSDMDENFTAVGGRFDAVDGNATDNNESISGLVLVVNGSITAYGDARWISAAALTPAQNATLNDIFSDMGLNFTEVIKEINATPERMWNSSWASVRILTSYPVGAISVVSLTEEGPFNVTFYNSEVGHVLGNVQPENALTLWTAAGERWAQNHLVIENLPSNVTNAKICLWLKNVGNPSNNLRVYMNDSFMFNLSASHFSTSWQKNCTDVAIDNVTNYNPITIRGDPGWTAANTMQVGMDAQPSLYSFETINKGATWTHTTFEIITYIEVEAYATSIADQINEKVVNVETHTPHMPCLGKPVNFHWAFYDFKGDQMTVNSVPGNCNMYYYLQNGSEVNVTGADIQTKIENSFIAWAFWNNTQDEGVNRSYHIDCNGITVTPPGGVTKTVDVDALFGFSDQCILQGRFDALDGNDTEIDAALIALSADLGSNSTKTYSLVNNVWQFFINGSLREEVWTHASRTLTSVSFHIFGNWSIMQDYMWNRSDRNLTWYGTNISISDIWNYASVTERNVTSSNERGTDSAELEVTASSRYDAVIGNLTAIGANVSLIYDTVNNTWFVLINGSLDASMVEYMHRQNWTEIWNYNGSNSWLLENRTKSYSDGVSKVMTFDYNPDGMQNKTLEETI